MEGADREEDSLWRSRDHLRDGYMRKSVKQNNKRKWNLEWTIRRVGDKKHAFQEIEEKGYLRSG